MIEFCAVYTANMQSFAGVPERGVAVDTESLLRFHAQETANAKREAGIVEDQKRALALAEQRKASLMAASECLHQALAHCATATSAFDRKLAYAKYEEELVERLREAIRGAGNISLDAIKTTDRACKMHTEWLENARRRQMEADHAVAETLSNLSDRGVRL